MGYPLRENELPDAMNDILRNLDPDHPGVSYNQAPRFLKRNPEFVKKTSKPLEYDRKNAEDPDLIKGWFKRLRDLLIKEGILPENCWNIDESGFILALATA